jgi:hypothetical protein
MRPVLQNQPEIGSLSQKLLESLRGVVAAISTGWNRQHNGDGTHGVVTATSVRADALITDGRLVLAGMESFAAPAVSIAAPLTPTTPVGVFRITGTVTIHGISAAGRALGDRIVIFNGGSGSITLIIGSATSVVGTRFDYAATTHLALATEFVLASGQWIEAIYLPTLTMESAVWRLCTVNEN